MACQSSEQLDEAIDLGVKIHAGKVKINGTSLLDMIPDSAQSFWGTSVSVATDGEVAQFFCASRIVGQDPVDAPL